MEILRPIEIAVAWIMVQIHSLLTGVAGMADGPGAAWVLSIVGLTIVIRILIIPLFFKQIKASRGMQMMQPELQALQKKYKGKTDPASRQAQQQEMMELYKKHNTNPFSSCLPILLQMPIFFALFQVLRGLEQLSEGDYQGKGIESIGPLTSAMAGDVEASTLFGAPISSTFLSSDLIEVKVVTVILILAMSATQFFSMKQLTMKNMPASSLDNPMMRQQMMMMYAMPVIFAVTGVGFPVGVLIYWTVTNIWSMGQQYYTIKRMPAPGSAAYRHKQEKDAAKRAKKGLPPIADETAPTTEVQPQAGQRVQPMRKDRAKKKAVDPAAPTAAGAADAQHPDADHAEEAEVEEVLGDEPSSDIRGKDGLTDAERARRRYEARAAERRAAREKRIAAERRRQQSQHKPKYNKDGS